MKTKYILKLIKQLIWTLRNQIIKKEGFNFKELYIFQTKTLGF